MTKEKCVLVVEKNGHEGRSIAGAVARAGFKADVRAVEPGPQMMDFLLHRGAFEDADQHPMPCLILFDLDGAGSVEYAGQVKRHPELRRIPMVVFTTSAQESDVRRGYEIGANSLIQRPETAERLVESLKVLERYWLESVELPSAR